MFKKLRIYFSLLLFMLVGLTMQAQQHTLEKAQLIATKFFQENAAPARMMKAGSSEQKPVLMWNSLSLMDSRYNGSRKMSANAEPTFYMFANPSGKGFAIISGDDVARPVIGYSFDSDPASYEGIPENMKEYLLGIDDAIKAQRASGIKYKVGPTDGTSIGNVVKYLETASWGQGNPYNRKCPKVGGSPSLTGCVPTALAIVMHYHKWPLKGTGMVSTSGGYAEPDRDISKNYYNLSDLPNSFSGTYTDKQAGYVAQLMYDAGCAVGAEYGTASTETTVGRNALTEMMTHFSYKDGKFAQKDIGYTDETWAASIKADIDAGRPIPYAASRVGSSSAPDARHMFVLDGYTDNSYYHFNWGWNGNCNGYYILTDMTPDNNGTYLNNHKAFFNLTPDRSAIPAEKYSVTLTGNAGTKVSMSVGGTTINSGDKVDAGSNILLSFNNIGTDEEAVVTVGSEQPVVVSGTSHTIYNVQNNITINVDVRHKVEKVTIKVKSNNISFGNAYIGSDKSTSAITVNKGTSVTIHAESVNSGVFKNWTSNMSTATISQKDYTFTADANAEFTANFEKPDAFPVTLTTNAATKVSMFVNNQAIASGSNVKAGSDVMLRFSMSTDEKAFVKINGGNAVEVSGTSYTIQNIQSATNIDVQILKFVTLTVSSNGTGGTAYIGDNAKQSSITVASGSRVKIHASAFIGNTFVNWTKNGSVQSTDADFEVTADANAEYVANFKKSGDTPAPGGTYYYIKFKNSNKYLTAENTGSGAKALDQKPGNNPAQLWKMTESNGLFEFCNLNNIYLRINTSGSGEGETASLGLGTTPSEKKFTKQTLSSGQGGGERIFYYGDAHDFELCVNGENVILDSNSEICNIELIPVEVTPEPVAKHKVTLTGNYGTRVRMMVGTTTIFSGDEVDEGSDVLLTFTMKENEEAVVTEGTRETIVAFGNTYTIKNVQNDVTLNVDIREKAAPVLRISVGQGGKVICYGTEITSTADILASEGEQVKMKLRTDHGYYLESVIFNGEDMTTSVNATDGTFTTPAISGKCTLNVTFTNSSEIKGAGDSNVKVYAQNGMVTIEGVNESMTVNIFTVSGVRAASVKPASSKISIRLAEGNAYIVNVAGRIYKIAL